MRWSILALASAALLLELSRPALAHGHEGTQADTNVAAPTQPYKLVDASSYFRHHEQSHIIVAHIALMTIAWVVVLPVAVMLSVARSHFAMLVQVIFLIVNGFGVILGVAYNRKTPILYENEKHGPVGWVSASVTIAWVIMSLITTYAGSTGSSKCRRSAKRLAAAAMAMFGHLDDPPSPDRQHLLGDFSGALHGQSSISSIESQQYPLAHDRSCEDSRSGGNVPEESKARNSRRSAVSRSLSRTFDHFSGFKRTLQTVSVIKTVLDRMVLLFGFICIATGLVIYGGIFRGNRVFNGLAHFIKGGVFFWYGLLTFGRWMGCFADFGWAWNMKPPKEVVGRWPAIMPSAEFVESATICFYGVTNVWLEHLSNPGGKWAANDLEHVSIALLFLAGGSLGMLVESTAVRDLLMTKIQLLRDERAEQTSMKDETFEEPAQWRVPLNPTPALVFFLLGSMMGAHTQASAVSTMLHALWGKLLASFSLARIATYAILYLKVPRSYLPQRPPTEIITSFCLMAGGLLLMMSSSDIVEALEQNSLDAMFSLNIVIALTLFLMAWAAACLALKGWVQRRQAAGMLFR